MAVITRLVASKGHSKKVRVYLDGKYAFSLEAAVALEAGLRTRPGTEPAENRVNWTMKTR